MEKNKEINQVDRLKRKKRRWKIFLIVLGALVCVRIALPYIILHYANEKLANLKGYYGHIDDIDLNLYRGAYVINDIYINNVEEKDTSEFFKCPHIDLSVNWSAVFKGKLVGEVEFDKPILNYTMGKELGKGEIKDDSTNFIHLVQDFMPLRIDRFSTFDGEIHYIDLSKSPDVDIPLTKVNIEGSGLTNETDSGVALPADIRMDAALYDGLLTVKTKLDPLSKSPTFDLNATLTNTNLTNFNSFFTAYGKFDVERGSMGLFIEVAALDGEFSGYVKPLMTDVKIVRISPEEGGPLQILWEAFLGGAVEVFENQSKDQFATKIQFDGKFKDPNIDVGRAILGVLRNAFITALKPTLDNDVSLDTVEEQQEHSGLFERIFKGNKDKKEKSKDGQ